MSTHISAQYGVPCPKCEASADEPCRSLTTHRVTDTHAARRSAYWRKRNQEDAKRWGK